MKVAETYVQMKERHQKEVNEFPMMWAFNNDQFAQGMKKLGLQETDTDKIYRIAPGGFIRKTDARQAGRDVHAPHKGAQGSYGGGY